MTDNPRSSVFEIRFAAGVFLMLIAAHVCLVSVGWRSGMLPGNEFRQVQTAIAAHHAQLEGYRLDYPMPLLGPPWFAPMEFPLYQWSVAAVSNLTSWPIIQSGRAVGLFCFYASLPAVWLLLRRSGLPAWQRLLTLGTTLASPVYIFYSRGSRCFSPCGF